MTQIDRPSQILIIGGGIAGAALSLFLQRAGFAPHIYEARAEADDEEGSFLNLASNGLEVMRTLGLYDAIAADGFANPRMIMWSNTGKRLGEVANGTLPGSGLPSMTVKRGQLHRVLREAVLQQGIPMHFGKRLQAITTEGDGVTARFEDGSQASGDILVGCDGLQSRVRQIVLPDAPKPLYTGGISCGAFTQMPTLTPTPGAMHMVFGKQAFFGYLVRQNGEVYWFHNEAIPGEPTRRTLNAQSNREWRDKLLAEHQDDPYPVPDIIRATESEIGKYPIYDIPSLPTWHQGRIVLIGDAAHATSPHAGQGASMALEDAITLAKCLRDSSHYEAAFTQFELLRRERVERVVRFSRQTGSIKRAPNAMGRVFRDALMPLFLRVFANPSAQAWLYTHRIEWETPISTAARQTDKTEPVYVR